MSVEELPRTAPAGGAPTSAPIEDLHTDPRLGQVHWPIPAIASARRRAMLMALLCLPLAGWYLSWLLQGKRIGEPVLFGLLIAAEAFNLLQAIGFWWTCSRQRVRPGKPAGRTDTRVDVLIPTSDEPLSVVEPTVAAACALRGADVSVWLLDDGHRGEMAKLAGRYGARYLRRRERSGAKAGNLNHALARSNAPFVAVLDCDHVPHIDFLERTLGHLDEERVAFVQTPQYYANAGSSAVCAAAAAQQSLFFGPIARGKDGLDAMMCCGTNMVLRREALRQVGGFPEDSLTEDFLLSIRLQERGWRSVYLSEVVASGLGPEDMASYVSQQQRWARGCLSSIPAVFRARLPWRARIQYLLSATYFLSGWTLLLYMSLPVIRLLFGLQPLAQISASQFLIHFAPYYCGAVAAVALAGSGTYTFGAFALSACNFWIHVQATANTLIRRAARFVVTPKHGRRVRQPRAIAPALLAVGTLIGASAYGLSHGHGPATVNNVAFAALHSAVLLIGAAPALRLAGSAQLEPEPPRPRVTRPRRSWPRPLAAAVLGLVALAVAAVAFEGSRALRIPPTLNQQAYAASRSFLGSYVTPDGQVIRRDQGGDTVSEGQAYGMLLAVALDDRSRFKAIWGWTRGHLLQPNGLLASGWSGGRVSSPRPATDADLDAAQALALASQRFGDDSYRRWAATMGHAILARETAPSAAGLALVAGPWARTNQPVINPSYFSPRGYATLSAVAPDPRWRTLVGSSRTLVSWLIGSTGSSDARSLPPDWSAVRPAVSGASPAWPISSATTPAGPPTGESSFDALRVAIRMASSCRPADRQLAAALWPLYRRAPGRDVYSLDGRPLTGLTHAASYVAAAASAAAAGHRSMADRLLGQAQADNTRYPTYYGSAWLALGRVLLTTSALGGCAS
ncbi:MAG TPA: glycosyl hydrolase family 8 [Solirubrobacteraceae bacterium]|nr:glycosyl hydrolase family 8 [Solirubrobacteraceae bacterium]